MKSFFKKMAIMLICMSVFLSYMPWNVVFATDEIAETPQNVINEEPQGSGEVTNPEEGNTQLENPGSNAEITEELQGELQVGNLKIEEAVGVPSTNPSISNFIFNESTRTIVKYSYDPNAPKDIKIPAQINGTPVEHIGDGAFKGFDITGLSFEEPTNLKTIGANAFSNNQAITGDLKIPAGVISIGTNAFSTCTGINSITIPDSTRDIAGDALVNCNNLEKINIPSKNYGGITGEPWGAPNATVYWKSTKTVGDYIVDIEKNEIVKYIGSESDITVPDKVMLDGTEYVLTKIRDRSFYDNRNLEKVTISDGITSIGVDAFLVCTNLKSINIPTKDKGDITGEPWGAPNAAVYWKNANVVDDFLIDINKGEILKYVGTKSNITVPSKVTIKGTDFNLTKIADNAFYGNQVINNVNISEGIKSIGKYAFSLCTALKNVKIPDSVTRIDSRAFSLCKNINIDINTKWRGSISGEPWGAENAAIYWSDTKVSGDFLIDTTNSVITKYLGNETVVNIPAEFVIDSKEYRPKSIGPYAFANKWQITGVNFECPSLTHIGEYAFSGCRNFHDWTFPNGNFVTSAGKYAFKDCKKLDRFSVINFTIIEEGLFYGCESIRLDAELEFKNITAIKEKAFYGCKSIREIYLREGLTEIGQYAFWDCNALKKIYLTKHKTDSIKGAPWGAVDAVIYWQYDDRLQYLLPQTREDIYDYLHYNIKNKEIFATDRQPDTWEQWAKGFQIDVTIPSTIVDKYGHRGFKGQAYEVNSIGRNAFLDKKYIKTVTIQDGISEIGYQSFANCSSLNTISIPASVNKIGMRAFEGCVSLKNVNLPEGVEEILANTFKDCNNLEKINIPDSTKKISSNVFSGCPKIKTLYIPEGVNYIDLIAFNNSGIETIYVDQNRSDSPIKNNQPWGATNAKVYYRGEFLNIDTTAEKVKGEYARNIKIEAYIDRQKLVSKIIMPDGTVVNAGQATWTGEFKATQNGTYVFKGYDDSGNETEKSVNISDIGKINLSAKNANINPEKVAGLTKSDLLKLVEASASDDAGDLTCDVSNDDLNKVKALKKNEGVSVTVTATNKFGTEKKIVNIVAVPDTVPGSQQKPAGYVTVTFAKGDHGSLSGELSQHVNPTKVTDLKALAPMVTADTGFKHTGWNGELKKKFTEDTTITATYEALPDTVPGSQEKPAGYVTVTFAKGEHGSLSGEMSQHVNPTKITDLKTLAPKVTADTGFKHTGWNGELKKKFTEDTTITATYEAVPDTVPGSQEKPAGYVTVTFAKGEHGKLAGLASYHVNPTKEVDLKAVAPKVTADTGFKHTGWNSELKKKFTEDTTITAAYDALPDTVPGSQEKPAGYVTVTFAKGEHGSLSGELSQHVNPGKEVDLNKVAPKVKADTGFKFKAWDKALKAKFDKDTTVTATYEALPDIVPGSQEKPAGYVTVTFAKGEHGKLEGETSQHVNPTKVTDLKTLAPKVKADIGFKHIGWDKELKDKFEKDTTITATYEALPDVIPGSQEKPAGYVTVTFAKGEHGSLSGETSQHVNPGKEVDLKTVAPKVTADTGFKHTGWDKELKDKFEKDTTVTATYKALPDVIPGSQEKPAGYVTVTFAKGEHGTLTGELSQHVNPAKEVDLKALAPKVTADTGFKFKAWDKALKAKFDKDTTVTATYEAVPEKFAITIDPDGGNWNGNTNPIVYNIEIGEYITLPDAPTKEGYTFKYWKGSKYMPGDKYKVEGDHKFTAVWEKKATSKTDDSSTGKAGTSGTAGANGVNANKTSTSNHAPFTADSQNIMLYLMMSIFSFVLILRPRSQEN